MKFLIACTVLVLAASAARAQVLLNVNITGPNTMVITATGQGPVTSTSGYIYGDGIDLEGLFVPVAFTGTQYAATTTSTLTTGDTSTGPVFDEAQLDDVSEENADLHLYNNVIDSSDATESFTFGLPAFAIGGSVTVHFNDLTLSGVGYGVIVAGFSADGDASGAPTFAAAGVGGPTSNGTTVIGVYHVTSIATPEPSTYAMMALGLLGLVGIRRFRQLS